MRRRRLKQVVQEVFYLIIFSIVVMIIFSLFAKSSDDFDSIAHECDELYGHTCSYYEVKNFKGGE